MTKIIETKLKYGIKDRDQLFNLSFFYLIDITYKYNKLLLI